MDELRLIKKIRRNGDRAAADELIRKYYDEIHRFVSRQVRGADIALDLTQDIFISVLKSISHFDPGGAAGFRTWLYKVASNKVVDYFRSKSYRVYKETLPIDEVEPLDEEDFVVRLADESFSEELYARLGDLPPDAQNIFRLHVFGADDAQEGMTFSEIALMLGLPEGSVKTKYYRLIAGLKKEFRENG